MRRLDDRAGIGVAVDRRPAGEHARVVGHFLVGAERAEGAPGERVEPVQRQHAERDPVGDQVAALVVAELVEQRELALVGVVALGEIAREGDVAAEDAERERPGRGLGLDHFDRRRRARSACCPRSSAGRSASG